MIKTSRRFLFLLSFYLMLVCCSNVRVLAQTASAGDKQRVLQSVSTFMTALRDGNSEKLHAIVTPGFFIFDNGSRLDADSMLATIKRLESSGIRFVWTIAEPEIHVEDHMAWIAYVNRGSINDHSNVHNQQWLESAVLVKQNGVWRIAFIHSTRAH